MKKLFVILMVFCLTVVTSFFVILAVMGGSFAATCLATGTTTLQNGADNQAKIFNYWLKQGFSPAQAAGITANLGKESGYSPFRQEDSRSWPRGGYGIAQFTGAQRTAVTTHLAQVVGADYSTYYSPRFGGPVTKKSGYVPTGIPVDTVNDKFLYAQLDYLLKYMSTFKPSSISVRVNGLQTSVGLTVPRDATLYDYIRSLRTASNTAKAWTYLYEYPGNIAAAAQHRAAYADTVYTQFTGKNPAEEDDSTIGSCGAISTGWQLPLEKGSYHISSYFGPRHVTIVGASSFHEGYDLATPYGAEIFAAHAGTVEVVSPTGGYGNFILIDNGDGTESAYGHLSAYAYEVSVGAQVQAGQVIGYVGSSGVSGGAHLHFEIRVNGTAVDPGKYLQSAGVDLGG